MRLVKATIFALKLPFVEAFAHSVRDRAYSDSLVVRVEAEDGTVGYGEAVARPYVTGETVASCLEHMAYTLWPILADWDFSGGSDRRDGGHRLAPSTDGGFFPSCHGRRICPVRG